MHQAFVGRFGAVQAAFNSFTPQRIKSLFAYWARSGGGATSSQSAASSSAAAPRGRGHKRRHEGDAEDFHENADLFNDPDEAADNENTALPGFHDDGDYNPSEEFVSASSSQRRTRAQEGGGASSDDSD